MNYESGLEPKVKSPTPYTVAREGATIAQFFDLEDALAFVGMKAESGERVTLERSYEVKTA